MRAIGDRAFYSALDALAAAQSANGCSDNRHHIAHLQLVAATDIPQLRALGSSLGCSWGHPRSATLPHETQEQQKDHRAHDGHDESRWMELRVRCRLADDA